MEEACRREVREETGVKVGEVFYHSSQPWPFPNSVMIGCLGKAVSDEIDLGDQELEDAKWFSRGEVKKAVEAHMSGDKETKEEELQLRLPPPYAIAYQLVKAWVEGWRGWEAKI